MKTTIILAVFLLNGCAKPAPSTEEPTAKLADQKLCAEGAEKSFAQEQMGTSRNTYTNHYDPVARVCYVETTTVFIISSAPFRSSFSHVVYDAFEGRVYGNFDSTSDREEPSMCDITPRNQPEIKCESREEFDRLALKYFGTTAD